MPVIRHPMNPLSDIGYSAVPIRKTLKSLGEIARQISRLTNVVITPK
jgi:hypothetical protein